jgi:hypothetical protein
MVQDLGGNDMDWPYDFINLTISVGSIISVIALVAAMTLILENTRSLILARRGAAEEESLEERIEILTNALADSAKLVSQIEREIDQRRSVVERLEQDAKTYQEIANLRRTEVEAVAQMIRGEIKTESRRSFWQQVAVNLLFFLLGIASTYLFSIFGG